MLVDDDATRAASVEAALLAAGYEVLSTIENTAALLFQIEQQAPDVVLIDLKFPGRDILESLSVINDHNPTPMVMFSGDNDPAYISQAFKAGVSTYLTENVKAETVKPIIDVALAQFESFQSLRKELRSAQSELQDTKTISRAKALLIKQKGITEADAHLMLKRLSMNNNLGLAEVARTVVATLGDEQEGNST